MSMEQMGKFIPKYSISPKLLEMIKQISAQIAIINTKRYPGIILAEYERLAREVSTYSSTSIEGNPLPLTEVKKILKNLPENITDSQKEVINYNNSLVFLNKLIEEGKLTINLSLILKIHKMVIRGLLPKSKSGFLREESVFVNDPRLRKPIYYPPNQKDVQCLLKNLLLYINDNIKLVDPLILAGIFHKQFVLIHPFIDGNGRTVRLTTKVMLAKLGLNTFNLFSFENYYNKNLSKYFKTVGERGDYYDLVNRFDFTEWLEFFAEGILDELFRVSKELDISEINPDTKLKDFQTVILNYIDKNGFITDKEYSGLTGRARSTRAKDFDKLIDLGLIKRMGKGKATYYQNS
jgi:Fic family protein